MYTEHIVETSENKTHADVKRTNVPKFFFIMIIIIFNVEL